VGSDVVRPRNIELSEEALEKSRSVFLADECDALKVYIKRRERLKVAEMSVWFVRLPRLLKRASQ